eukprot:8497691-Pyramimonas_sp.AAC.1
MVLYWAVEIPGGRMDFDRGQAWRRRTQTLMGVAYPGRQSCCPIDVTSLSEARPYQALANELNDEVME